MDRNNLVKKYTNGEITVIWKNALCNHSRICFTELVEVFNPRIRPWINMQGATTQRIIEQVERCPTKALSWEYNNKKVMEENTKTTEKVKTDLEFITNGPIKVNNDVSIKNADGEEKLLNAPVFLCRCGGSNKKPYCDGSHRNNGFKG